MFRSTKPMSTSTKLEKLRTHLARVHTTETVRAIPQQYWTSISGALCPDCSLPFHQRGLATHAASCQARINKAIAADSGDSDDPADATPAQFCLSRAISKT